MGTPRLFRDSAFLVSLTIILVTVIVSLATFFRWVQLRFQVGPFSFTHWLAWIGSLFIFLYTPIYYIFKRRNPRLVKVLIKIHVFGNLFAAMFISVHYAQQMGRPPQFYPDLGTGLALYIIVFTLVTTGFLHRFGILSKIGRYRVFLPHQNRFLHIAITLSFYLLVVIHTLQNTGIL